MTNSHKPQNKRIQAIDLDEFHGMIAERAYYKAEKRGFVPGYETEDWLEAGQEIRQSIYSRRKK